MAHIIVRKNPLQPHDREIIPIQSGISVRDALISAFGSAEFELPTLVSLNDTALMRADWGVDVKDGDCIIVSVLPSGGVSDALMAFANWPVYSYYKITDLMGHIIPMPKIPGTLPTPDPVFTLSGQQNTAKLMQPIEVAYGRNRLYPSYAARPYACYKSNQQFLYQLLCLGQGYFDVHSIKIEDTDISSFQEVQYEIVPPGGQITLFPDNVITVDEVAGLELFGDNQEEFTVYGPYVVCPSGSKTNLIEYDVTLPQGLYFMNKNGGMENFIIDFLIEAQAIDDNGVATGSWFYLDKIEHFEMATNQPQRFTFSVPVTEGRYQIRGQRIGPKDMRSKAINTIIWEAARAFLPSKKDYGDVTILAVIAQATNSLSNNTSSKINVDATRKIKYRENGAWTWGPTRGIAWAFFDLFTAKYGAQISENYIDIDELDTLNAIWESRNEHFDYVFNQKTTIWEAAKTIARCGRAVPIINGSQISLVRDAPQSIPMGVFGVENIVRDSFKWEVSLYDPSEPDSVELAFVNPTTGKEETILCIPPGSEGANPEKVTLSGCTERNHAYHEGLYVAMCQYLLRETVSFQTGMEGYNPSFGDLIAVSYPLPKWGVSGYVTGRSGNTFYLSEEVVFESGVTSYILLRKNDGTGDGPIPVTPVSGNTYAVYLNNAPVYPYDFDDAGKEPVLFAFGPGDEWSRLCKITEISPSGDETVDISCVVYDEGVFQYDSLDAPAIGSVTNPPDIPLLPVIKYLNVSPDPTEPTTIIIAWSPAVGATSYLLQASFDGTHWVDATATTGTTHTWATGRVGMTYLRVCGYSPSGKGNWFNWSGMVGASFGAPFDVEGLSLAADFVGNYAKIKWNEVVDADSYRIKVYRDGTSVFLREEETTYTDYTYTIDMMRQDGTPDRNLHFEVWGKNGSGYSETAATLDATNPAPAQITTGFTSAKILETSEVTIYRLGWPAITPSDLDGYRVWGSTTSGFTVAASTLRTVTTSNQVEITLSKVARSAVITNISKAAAAVVTAPGHGFNNDEQVIISDVVGMTAVNGNTYTVKNKTADTFQIWALAGSSGTGIIFEFDELGAYVPTDGIRLEFSEPVYTGGSSGGTTALVPVNSSGFGTYVPGISGGVATITPVEVVTSKFYWRVAAVDIWGPEYNASPEQTAQ